MEESVSGFKCRGTWADIVEHGERITRALRDNGAEGEAFEEWDEWRPKSHERLGEDVNEKTAEQASVGEGDGEKAERRARSSPNPTNAPRKGTTRVPSNTGRTRSTTSHAPPTRRDGRRCAPSRTPSTGR